MYLILYSTILWQKSNCSHYCFVMIKIWKVLAEGRGRDLKWWLTEGCRLTFMHCFLGSTSVFALLWEIGAVIFCWDAKLQTFDSWLVAGWRESLWNFLLIVIIVVANRCWIAFYLRDKFSMACSSERWIDRLQFSSLFGPPPQDAPRRKVRQLLFLTIVHICVCVCVAF